MKFFSFFLSFFLFSSCSHGQFDKIFKTVTQEVSDEEVIGGLKEALSQGTSKGSDLLSKVDGYYKSPYKILLPEEAQSIVSKLKVVPGFSDFEAKAIEKINRSAEDAASKAKPIFINAIKQMSFKDAWNILMGEDNAATVYLIGATRSALYGEFNPVIVTALNKQGALDYWSSGVNTYNKLPFVKQLNPDLADHVTNKALDGLFQMIEKEEKDIRTNLASCTTDLLKKVFGKQDKGSKKPAEKIKIKF